MVISLQLVWQQPLTAVMTEWEQTIPSVIPGFKIQSCKSQGSLELPFPFVQQIPPSAWRIDTTHPIRISGVQRHSHFHKLFTCVFQKLFLLHLLNKKQQNYSLLLWVRSCRAQDRGTCFQSPHRRLWTIMIWSSSFIQPSAILPRCSRFMEYSSGWCHNQPLLLDVLNPNHVIGNLN